LHALRRPRPARPPGPAQQRLHRLPVDTSDRPEGINYARIFGSILPCQNLNGPTSLTARRHARCNPAVSAGHMSGGREKCTPRGNRKWTIWSVTLALSEPGRTEGMLAVEDWAEIRRLRRSEGMPIQVIARVMGVSRNTVKRALASDRPPKYE